MPVLLCVSASHFFRRSPFLPNFHFFPSSPLFFPPPPPSHFFVFGFDFNHHFPSQHAKTIFGLHDTHLVARQAVALPPSSNAPCTLTSPPAPRRRQSINSIESRHADVPFFWPIVFYVTGHPSYRRYLLDSSAALTQR
jgi:hypothetical protein